MTVDFVGYVITIGGLALLLWGVFYLAGRNNKGLKNLGFLLAIGVVVANRWVCPNVYIVDECGSVTEKYMVLPTTTPNGVPMRYGSHCYLINNSESSLWVSTVFYGNKNEKNSAEETIAELIAPETDIELDIISLDYFFEEPRSVKSRQKDFLKYMVTCGK